jgi:branched-subunit amino acid aminotransferase/4-amino-4-deoxychorismate lyase
LTPVAQLNGVPVSRAQITALALYNYGHYTSMRVDDMQVRGLSLHLQRLVQDCRRLFDAQLDPDWVRCLVRQALAEAPRSVLVRMTVFDPDLPLERTGADARPQLLVTTRPAAATSLPALRLQSTQYRRELPAVKHVGLFGSLRRRRIAQRNGFDDALFTDAGTEVSEAATSNIGVITGERIIWPQAPCLAGVTMRLINQAVGAQAGTSPITLGDLSRVDAVFATNAAIGIRPISTVDGTHFPTEHPMIDTLCKRYAAIPPDPV